MKLTRRRSFLPVAALAISDTGLLAQGTDNAQAVKPILVKSGSDHDGKSRTVGVSHTSYKVLTAETAGAMFVMEQANSKQGGPARHLHLNQDELFYVLEGEYIVEVGSERFHLMAGDCVLGPRRIPHAWAFVGKTSGRLLLTYSPAGQMEDFFNHRAQLGIRPGSYASTKDADTMRAYGMELVGPPIKIEEL
jgi:mannose-6-phosphate isomerase-like protein (cupin superfamily)